MISGCSLVMICWLLVVLQNRDSLTYLLTQLKFSCSARLPRTAPAPSTTGRSCAAPPAPLATRRGQRSSCATGAGSAGCWHGHNHGRLHSYVILTKILTIIYINSFVQPSLNSIPWACLTAPPPLSNHTAFPISFWLAELRSASPWKTNVTNWLTHSWFCKMTRVDRIASNKPELDMVLPCIPSQFGLGIVWLCLVWFGWVWFGVVEFGLVWMSLVWCGWVQFGMDEFSLV